MAAHEGPCSCGYSSCRRMRDRAVRGTDLEAFDSAESEVTGRRISGRAEHVAACLALLDCAIAVTSNGAALISESGSYAAPSLTGGALPYSEGLINVRLHAPGLDVAIAADPDTEVGRPAALHLFDGAGSNTHRAHAMTASDALVVDGMAREGGMPVAALDLPTEGVSAARAWRTGDQLDHLDAIIADSVDRRRHLSELDPHDARRVDPQVVPLVLSHLCTVGLVVTIGVPTATLLQFRRSMLAAVDYQGTAVSVAAGSSTVSYDRASVVECWAVRSHGVHGPTTSLELYDAAWRCVLVITQLGIVGEAVHEAWEHLTDSLPDA